MFRIVISVKYTNCDINILKIAAFFREEVKKHYCPYMGHFWIMCSSRDQENQELFLIKQRLQSYSEALLLRKFLVNL